MSSLANRTIGGDTNYGFFVKRFLSRSSQPVIWSAWTWVIKLSDCGWIYETSLMNKAALLVESHMLSLNQRIAWFRVVVVTASKNQSTKEHDAEDGMRPSIRLIWYKGRRVPVSWVNEESKESDTAKKCSSPAKIRLKQAAYQAPRDSLTESAATAAVVVGCKQIADRSAVCWTQTQANKDQFYSHNFALCSYLMLAPLHLCTPKMMILFTNPIETLLDSSSHID